MGGSERHRLAIAVVVFLGLLALLTSRLAPLRLSRPELRASDEIRVRNGSDGGPGSLREAIFIADRTPGRARIVLAVPRVVVTTPLPPLVNPDGIALDAVTSGCEIDASALETGALLEVAAPDTVLSGVRIRGARGQAILVHAPRVLLQDLAIHESEAAIYLVEGAVGVRIERVELSRNRTGVFVGDGVRDVVIHQSRFEGHSGAGVWAVAAVAPEGSATPRLTILDCDFGHDRIGVVASNVPARIEGNRFVAAAEMAIFVGGPVDLRSNRVRTGLEIGIYAAGADGAVIEDNEIDGHAAVGLLVRESAGAVVRANRVYGNGYGIVSVFGDAGLPARIIGNLVTRQLSDGIYVVGGSPLVRGNQLLANGAAGLRVLDFVPRRGPRLVAAPLLEENTLSGNGTDAPVRGEYVVTEAEETVHAAAVDRSAVPASEHRPTEPGP